MGLYFQSKKSDEAFSDDGLTLPWPIETTSIALHYGLQGVNDLALKPLVMINFGLLSIRAICHHL